MKIKPNIKKPELVEKRQAQVYEAAVKLFVQKGFHGTSIRDIARESDLGIGPIYDYFKNKEQILFFVQKKIVEENYLEIKETIDGIECPKQRILKIIETQLNKFVESQDLFLFIYQEGHLLDREMKNQIIEIEKKTISLIEEILKEGQKKKLFRKFDCRFVANMVILLTHGWILKRWDLKSNKGIQPDFTTDLILNGISR
jgi:AcrR family transcriptional regulator